MNARLKFSCNPATQVAIRASPEGL